jgi:signal transduction histidine kinase
MQPSIYAPRLRGERLIAAGRIVLGASSLFAIWFDPNEPANYAGVAYGLLVAYVGYAVGTALLLGRVGVVWRSWPALTHGLDLVFFSLFVFLTEGPSSPFTTYFVFALVSATLRWQSRGTLWTAVVALAVFLGVGVSRAVQYPDFELHGFIIRVAYLVVIAVLLGYLGAHEHRTLREMWQLASWPQSVPSDARTLATDLLAYASQLLAAPRAVLVWTEPEAPWRQMVVWDEGTSTYDRLATTDPLVAARIGDRPFVSAPHPSPRTVVHDARTPELTSWEGGALEGDLARRFGGGVILSAAIAGEGFEGRLFFLDKPEGTLDDLVLAEVVAGLVSARLQAFFLTEELRQAAANEERVRLARDLHDGVLQSFTGAALRLAAIQKLMPGNHAAASEALGELQRVLAAEQRDLRFFIQELRPQALPIASDRTLHTLLLDLSDRMEREWDLHVDLTFSHDDQRIPQGLARDVYLIVREGLVNAARHGAASVARVNIEHGQPDSLSLSIADNGRGFAFVGCYDTEELVRRDLGPKTLRERILALHGSLTLRSGPGGAELRMVLPATAET